MKVDVDDTAVEMLVALECADFSRKNISTYVSDAVVQYVCMMIEDPDLEWPAATTDVVEKGIAEYWRKR